jgi:hypothetical protein
MRVPSIGALKPVAGGSAAFATLMVFFVKQRKNSGNLAVLSFAEPSAPQDFRGKRDADGC